MDVATLNTRRKAGNKHPQETFFYTVNLEQHDKEIAAGEQAVPLALVALASDEQTTYSNVPYSPSPTARTAEAC